MQVMKSKASGSASGCRCTVPSQPRTTAPNTGITALLFSRSVWIRRRLPKVQPSTRQRIETGSSWLTDRDLTNNANLTHKVFCGDFNYGSICTFATRKQPEKMTFNKVTQLLTLTAVLVSEPAGSLRTYPPWTTAIMTPM